MPMPEVVHYGPDNYIHLPVTGGGTNLVIGQFMKRGPTAGTNQGSLVQATGAGAHPDMIGILKQAHTASGNDTDEAGTIFTTRPIDLISHFRVVRAEYSLLAADDIDVASNSGTTLTITSLEASLNTCFFYVSAGAGIGQLKYVTATTGDDATLKEAFTTTLNTTSRVIKILPLFHQTMRFTAIGTRIASGAAAGSIDVMVLRNYIVVNGDRRGLSPVRDSTRIGLNGNASLYFECDFIFQDTASHPID